MTAKKATTQQPAQHYQSLYRAYRPQQFNEVVGQDHIVSVLQSTVAKGTPSHAYLFSGGRGTGKTSLARIFAKALGTSAIDTYEIDAASNRKVEEARELISGVATLPLESKYKVYIIDEVHMLTKDAFNTLLKTLEEPPAHVIFILATTEKEKVLDTVVSRCQSYTFKTPTIATLTEVVQNIAKKEGITLARENAELIARSGDGSFRDTLGVLEKVLLLSADKKLSEDEIRTVTGVPPRALVMQFVQALGMGNKEDAVTTLEKVAELETNTGMFLDLALDAMRAILVLRFGNETLVVNIKERYSDDEFAQLQSLAKEGKGIDSQLLLKLLQLAPDLVRTKHPVLFLETIII